MRRLPLLVLFLLASCGGSDGPGPTPRGADRPPHRLLVIGWDGASFREVDRLLEAGRLPHVAALRDRGLSAELASTIIPISSAAWPAAFTGRSPGETGVFSFFEALPGTYDVRLISARSVRATPLWRILSARGLRSIVFGVPITYPPEPILGTLVAGMLSPFDAAYTWPPEYADALRARGFEPDLDTWVEARPVGWEDVRRQLEIKEAVLGELLAGDDWDFAMVVFKSLDVMSHLSYGVDFHAQVGPLYERLDAILGGLVARVGEDTDVVLLSDHGFREYGSGVNLAAWMLAEGFSVRREGAKRFTIPESAPLGRRERLEIRALRSELDWTKTRAFATRCEGNFGSIRLNLAGREPEGCVEEQDRAATLAELEARLRAFRDPTGVPVVREVWRTADLYPGPYVDLLPDLLFETVDGCQVFSDASEPRVAGNYDQGVPDHERTGIFFAAGPSFRSLAERGSVGIRDLAPTALHLLHQAVPSDMSGEVLTRFLREDRPVLRGDADAMADPGATDLTSPYTPEQMRALEQRLGGLGYGR